MVSWHLGFLLAFLQQYHLSTSQTCDINTQQCGTNEHCTAQTAKMTYPDVKTWGTAIAHEVTYNCASREYCEWGDMWGESCIRVHIPDKPFQGAWYDADSKSCNVITIPIGINLTVACCQDGQDCDGIFAGIAEKETSNYTTQNCAERSEVGERLEKVVGCYATDEFMKYIRCNVSSYEDQCPNYFFSNLETYAKCACAQLSAFGDDSYAYFRELTNTIEEIFRGFRNSKVEDCPSWTFSCNGTDGSAQLDVFEIVCPLYLDEDSDVDELLSIVNENVYALTDDQVEIFDGYIRVLMYSEDEAYEALDWLSLNSTDETPSEIGSACTFEETLWNLNKLYGDYIPPLATPAPTDDGCRLGVSGLVVSVVAVAVYVFAETM